MAPIVSDWLAVLDEMYPPAWAEEWDSSGFQAGDRGWPAPRVLVALDPTEPVVSEARDRGCGLLITHHPLVFRPLQSLDVADPVARTAAQALASRVAVAACHTNADVAGPGVSDALAEALGLEITGVLRRTEAGGRVKLVTFVPADATAKVLDAVAAAGAGVICEYTHCSFRVRGTGTFLPSERSHPVLGERGQLNEVEEDRLEVLVPRDRLQRVIEAMVQAHPYEEVAHDVYPLTLGGGMGLGRMARPRERLTVGDLARRCRERLGSDVRVAGDPQGEVRTAALCGGSGAALIGDAVRSGADVYVTGDVKHHQALDALGAGLTVVDAGHRGTEWPFVAHLAARLREVGGHLDGEVLVSELNTDPFMPA
jgi:dinuclear metal center YbgI/SA1388 family protein